MATVMICTGIAGPFSCNTVGQYLQSCDFDACNGRGYVAFTPDLDKAMKFPDKAAALQYWNTQSKTAPMRLDGKPNRPLTAYCVTIEDVGVANDQSNIIV
jgi:hypothetical protein